MYESKRQYQYGTGRRKSSVARVRVYQGGTGSITINGRDIDDYFGLDTLKMAVRQPLAATDLVGKVDIICTVEGGGVSGQAGAIRHGIARALVKADEELKPAIKKAGYLTRDPRMRSVRSTVSRPHVAHRSSPRDNWARFYNQNASKTPEIRYFRGFSMSKIADTVCPNLNGFGVIWPCF